MREKEIKFIQLVLIKLFGLTSILSLLICIIESKKFFMSQPRQSVIVKSIQTAEIHLPLKSLDENNGLPTQNREQQLWREVMTPLLTDQVWQEVSSSYNAGHFLMVPLHGAFASGYQPGIDEFEEFFKRFTKEYSTSYFKSLNRLSQLHFLYLASEYLVLVDLRKDRVPVQLVEILLNSLDSLWNTPAWQWDSPPFAGGIAERLRWKLSNQIVSKSYYRAIIDEELFAFAIAANLKTILSDVSPSFIDEILNFAYAVLEKEAIFINTQSERWLFQPGVWSDHPDYAYAGWNVQSRHLARKPLPGIASDTSHSHRWPLWLVSLKRAFNAQNHQNRVEYIKKLQRGLASQFTEKVLVHPSEDFSNYRTTNFMDGLNGIYRYNYNDNAPLGYAPYELSGTFLIGWWAFLPDDSVRDAYCYIGRSYPLSDEELSIYRISSNMEFSDLQVDGSSLRELINLLACKLMDKS